MKDLQPGRAHAQIFHTLDMLRGVAAIAVAGRHLNHIFLSAMPESSISVDLFFVLSGFVIDHAYRKRLEGNFSFLSFMKTRLIRLYPLYAFGSLLGIFLSIAYVAYDGHFSLSTLMQFLLNVFAAMIFLPLPPHLSFNHYHAYPFNFPAWSLFWELVVNVIYALVIRYLSAVVLAAFILFGLVLIVGGTFIFHAIPGDAHGVIFMAGIMRVIFPFFVGVGLQRLWARGYVPVSPIPTWATALVFIALISCHPVHEAQFDLLVILFGFPLLVAAATKNPSPKLIPVYSMLGGISYAMYAIHGPLSFAEIKLSDSMGNLAFGERLVMEIAFILCVAGVSLIANHYVDIPVRKWLSRKMKSKVSTQQGNLDPPPGLAMS